MNPLFAVIFAADDGHAVDPARSVHWLLPEAAELIYGTISSAIIFFVLWKFAGPPVMKYFRDRTERIQEELDHAETARTDAEAEAAEIRRAAGDIDAERTRLFAEADAQAEALLVEGRAKLEAEAADMEARAEADLAAAANRVGDELRAEISRLSGAATDRIVAAGLDDDTRQALIENFIQKVGAQGMGGGA